MFAVAQGDGQAQEQIFNIINCSTMFSSQHAHTIAGIMSILTVMVRYLGSTSMYLLSTGDPMALHRIRINSLGFSPWRPQQYENGLK